MAEAQSVPQITMSEGGFFARTAEGIAIVGDDQTRRRVTRLIQHESRIAVDSSVEFKAVSHHLERDRTVGDGLKWGIVPIRRNWYKVEKENVQSFVQTVRILDGFITTQPATLLGYMNTAVARLGEHQDSPIVEARHDLIAFMGGIRLKDAAEAPVSTEVLADIL